MQTNAKEVKGSQLQYVGEVPSTRHHSEVFKDLGPTRVELGFTTLETSYI
jgi:hypothetical protein